MNHEKKMEIAFEHLWASVNVSLKSMNKTDKRNKRAKRIKYEYWIGTQLVIL